MDKNINLFMKKLKETFEFHRVKFIILYGSQTNGKASKMSDYDFAIYYEGDKKERFEFLIKTNFNKKFDVKLFQDLPLFIRKNVLKGKLIYAEDISFTYDVAYETIKEFENFKKSYYDYIGLEMIT